MKYVIVLLFFVFSSNLFAAKWAKAFGGAGGEHAYSVAQTSDGGYIVAGYTYSYGASDYDFWFSSLTLLVH